ncbi:hypothetical protein [Kribbella albertanoniae]|uniref:SAF domain-containing protein n=1 Tax=Kribbella albertanoniae TaxID=1266829 RepID=A0A4R4Q782_9ACTN|nr:hypothetical protein [Kribbella albertanoniae]TDC30909.1 hypothetical protein E1261_12240 [Kribbella albertanoniae]
MSLSSSTRTPAPNARGTGRPAGGGANRLPNSRERRPALAALAVILILLGAAGSALIALNSGNREGYVAVKKDFLPPGHQITAEDLTSGDLAGATGALTKWSERQKIIGKYTKGWLYQEQYIGGSNVTDVSPIPSGAAQVGVVLDAGRAPSDGLKIDDIVQVVRVPSANQDSVGPATLVSAAAVTSAAGGVVADKGSTVNTLNVTILVPAGKATAVAAAAASKTLVLVKLNPATKTDVPRTNGGG